jgi:hypothetical protein
MSQQQRRQRRRQQQQLQLREDPFMSAQVSISPLKLLVAYLGA